MDDIVSRIADGLDALTDGRGFDAGHQEAFNMANASPYLFEALEECLAWAEGQGWHQPGVKKAQAAIDMAKDGPADRAAQDPRALADLAHSRAVAEHYNGKEA